MTVHHRRCSSCEPSVRRGGGRAFGKSRGTGLVWSAPMTVRRAGHYGLMSHRIYITVNLCWKGESGGGGGFRWSVGVPGLHHPRYLLIHTSFLQRYHSSLASIIVSIRWSIFSSAEISGHHSIPIRASPSPSALPPPSGSPNQKINDADERPNYRWSEPITRV